MEKRMDTFKKAKHLAACTAVLIETATHASLIQRTHRVVPHKYLVSLELSLFHFSPEAYPGPSVEDRILEAFGLSSGQDAFYTETCRSGLLC